MSRTRGLFCNAGLAILLAVMLNPPSAQASNLILNGNFSAGAGVTAISGSTTQAGYWASPTGTGTSAYLPSNWNIVATNGTATLDCVVVNNTPSLVTNASGDVCGNAESQTWGFNYTVPNAPISGNYFGMDATPGYQGPLYQTVSAGISVGQTYILSFYAAVDQQYGFTQSITANWDVAVYGGSAAPTSTTTYTSIGNALAPSNSQQWVLETYSFVATSTTETIAFLANSTAGSGPPFALLSNVSLNATPEPGTMILMGLGLLSIPMLHKLRKKRR